MPQPTPQPATANAGGDDAAQYVWLYQATRKLYPRAVSGLFARWRWGMVALTQAVFYGLPWLSWNGRPAVLLELVSRRFYIFGLVLYPQDLIYLTALLLISAYALFLFTAVAGRLWCGYACPQTVYTEIFLWVERRFEGDRAARMKRDEGPWTASKLLRRLGKHLGWIAIAGWTGFTFVGYFTPIRALAAEIVAGSLGAWELFWVCFYGFATYGNAGHMREQVCKYMCPYARFQGAMFDPDTLVITYDAGRGEPRGSRSRKADPRALGLGDCIDCNLCVQVCPTGIDIRNGQQYECIGCAACVDVCDEVMDKLSYPRGLVRYDTQRGMAEHLTRAQVFRRMLRPRVLVYCTVLALVCGALATSIALRSPFRVDVVRDRATLARQIEDGWVENVYRLQIMNATESGQRYRIAADGLPGLAVREQAPFEVGAAQARWVNIALRVPPQTAGSLAPGAHEIHFAIERLPDEHGSGSWSIREKSTFMLPR